MTFRKNSRTFVPNKKNQTMSIQEIMEIVKTAFDEEISAEVGNHFGSPSAHIAGKDSFLSKIEEQLKKFYPYYNMTNADNCIRAFRPLKNSYKDYNRDVLI